MKSVREFFLGSLVVLCCWPAPAQAGGAAAQSVPQAIGGVPPEAQGPLDQGRASGAGAEPGARAWETQSVRELMQEDLREALSRPRAQGGASSVSVPLDQPRLVALYGVGSALLAEVHVDRHAYLYVRGQPWPAGHVGDPGVFQLRGMNGACIQLERGADRHSLCLRMLLGEARP
ncbi:hypothetical protein [Castellaniella sp.]|uniref:hypothetical protein n=1 Tax=Castellaniella sp. TaxID=1955812 RepID=UPI00356AFDA6